MTIRLIGLTGKAGAGKDTVADRLVSQFGFVKYSLAAPLKEILNARFGWTMEMWEDREWKERPANEHGRLTNAGAVPPFSPRSWAQWLGTDVMRKYAGEDIWVRLMQSFVAQEPNPIVIADVRFDNEAKAIKALGGVVIRVINPDAPGVEGHVSETGVFDGYVDHFVEARMGETDKLIKGALVALGLEKE